MKETDSLSMTGSAQDPILPYPNQEAVLLACANGDIRTIQNVFTELNIKDGDPVPEYWRDYTGRRPPLTNTMLYTAVANQHYDIITLVMSTFKHLYVGENVICKILDEGDVDALRALHASDKRIVDYTFGDLFTLYTRACHGAPKKTGLVLIFLAEHGVDFEGGPLKFLTWNLVPAIAGGHSVEVLAVLAQNGAKIDSWAVDRATKDQRADVLRLFVDMGGLNERGRVSWETVVGNLREAALNTDDVQIVKLVETLLALEERKDRQHEIEAEALQRKKWWHKLFRTFRSHFYW